VEFATPLEEDEDRLDAFHDDDEPLRYRTVGNILGDAPTLEPPPRLFVKLHLTHTGEPASYAEAKEYPAWRAVMEQELASVEQNSTWELVNLPAGHRPISLKWVFKLKKNKLGAVIKHKARLVAGGFVQQEGIDYDDAFAPVARMESVRVLLTLAAQEGWRVHHMDVKSAFLNGDLKEEVFEQQPPGCTVAGEEGKVYRLHKALYGLRQAPRAWNAKVDNTLKALGFQQSAHDAAMYERGSGRTVLLVGVYVDDLIITGAAEDEVEAFKAQMKIFDMSDLGALSFYLGVEVHQHATRITLRQTHYAKRILELGGMEGCNPTNTPMEERLRLSKNSTTALVDPTHYRRLIGSLRYLVHTRPDLAYAVGFVSQFMEQPTVEHQGAVKQILRYLTGTLDFGLDYTKALGGTRFIGYTDSDLAGDVDTSKSTSGSLFFLGSCLVSWHSIKQKVVALSSCEAEYIAASTATTQALWLSRLLAELLGRGVEVVELKMDSKSALALAKNPVFHEKSKHIRIKYHFLKSCLEDGTIKAEHLSTTDQLADILTKSLGKAKFQEMRGRIGLRQINPMAHKAKGEN